MQYQRWPKGDAHHVQFAFWVDEGGESECRQCAGSQRVVSVHGGSVLGVPVLCNG